MFITRSYRDLALDAKSINEEKRSIRVVASTPTEDSYEEIVEQSWRLERYKKNPIVLYEHGHASGLFGGDGDDKFPIGKAEDVAVENGVLMATLVLAPESVSPRAERVWQALKGGFLRAVSVGFRPHSTRVEKRDDREIYVLSDNELYEISVVAIPANPDAVAEQRAKSFAALVTQSPEAVSTADTVTEIKTMTLTEILAKRFGCEANDAAVVDALDAQEKAAAPVKARAAIASVFLNALSLSESATEGDASKALVELTSKAAKVEGLESTIAEQKKSLDERASADAEREVEWLIKHGEKYGTEVSEKSRKALLAYRKSDPKGFAEDYAPALEGLKKFDDTMLFDDVAAPTEKGANPPPQESRVDEGEGGEAAIERAIDEIVKKQAAQGNQITRAKAYDLLASQPID